MAPFFVNSIEVIQRPANRPSWGQPKKPTSLELPAGSNKIPEARALPTDIVLDQDQVLTLRDGTLIRADIYRPKTDDKVPAVLAWGPYGKSGTGFMNLDKSPLRGGVQLSQLSGYESFEGLDPAEWVPRGYAIVNVDARGCGDSEGDLRVWGTAEGRDGHDAIEEIAKLPWCSGRVSMAGNSWLALAQWFIAAERPPHLACIAPLEGCSDHLREALCTGGIPNTDFNSFISSTLTGRGLIEDTTAMVQKHPNTREYWDDKRARMDNIQVPAYILGGYNFLHTLGAFRGFEEIPHAKKWLTVHATHEWHDLYTKERTEDLAKFFDHYLKGVENGWERTPPVRLSVLGFNKPPVLYKPLDNLPWLAPDASRTQLFLSHDGKTLQQQHLDSSSSQTATFEYKDGETLQFSYVFPRATQLLGPSKIVVHASCPSSTDLDVFVQLQKRDKDGNETEQILIPADALHAVGVPADADLKTALPNLPGTKYLGPTGRLRVSKRKVAPELSQGLWDTLAHDADEPLKTPGEIVRLEIWIWPAAIRFEAGEQLVLAIGAKEFNSAGFGDDDSKMLRPQLIHVGGEHEAFLDVLLQKEA